MFKKVLIIALLGSCLTLLNPSIFADNVISESGGSASSTVILSVEPAKISYISSTECYLLGSEIVTDIQVNNLSNFSVLLKSVTITVDDKEMTQDLEIELPAHSSLNIIPYLDFYFEQQFGYSRASVFCVVTF